MVEIEKGLLESKCDKCGYVWKPFGEMHKRLPHIATITCPKCNYTEINAQWADSDTNKKMFQKKLGLLENPTVNNKIIELEKRITILEQALELEKKRRELAEADTQWVKEWAKRREKDFEDIELLLEEEKEKQRFRDDIGT